MIDLISEISQKSKLLDAAVQELGKRGRSYAQSEQEYRIALAKRILDERSKGTPVTIISDICRGDREIAKLRFERDCAEVVYKSALEAGCTGGKGVGTCGQRLRQHLFLRKSRKPCTSETMASVCCAALHMVIRWPMWSAGAREERGSREIS